MAEVEAPLASALERALDDGLKAGGAGPEREAYAAALAFVQGRRADVSKALKHFGLSGYLADGASLPASTYNDFYKFTMLPVGIATEASRSGGVRCTFSVNVRDSDLRKRLLAAMAGGEGELHREVVSALSGLAKRRFDRDLFQRAIDDYKIPLDAAALDAVCGTVGAPRFLCDEVDIDPSRGAPGTPKSRGGVLVDLFVAEDAKLGERRVYIEATGPWHRVTWLETTLMQAVYDALMRVGKRGHFGAPDEAWFPRWLAEAFARCVRGVAAAEQSGLRGALFTGRRTGGLSLMMLQGMYYQHAFGRSLGSSSVTSHYWLKDSGVSAELIPRCAGTHAHELSMVLGAVLGGVDDEVGAPLSQVVGHMLYFFCSLPQGDVRQEGRKNLMPMLPDTLGTEAFMKTASVLTVPFGPHKGEPVLSVIGAARQDSGTMEGFKDLMGRFRFPGALMASEIEAAEDLPKAAQLGYALFGAGGFFGDSEKAWDPSKKNISMAVKVLRVHVGGTQSKYYPVKTGDPSGHGEGKFEADGIMSPEALAAVKERTKRLAAADITVDTSPGGQLQSIFKEELDKILHPSSAMQLAHRVGQKMCFCL